MSEFQFAWFCFKIAETFLNKYKLLRVASTNFASSYNLFWPRIVQIEQFYGFLHWIFFFQQTSVIGTVYDGTWKKVCEKAWWKRNSLEKRYMEKNSSKMLLSNECRENLLMEIKQFTRNLSNSFHSTIPHTPNCGNRASGLLFFKEFISRFKIKI